MNGREFIDINDMQAGYMIESLPLTDPFTADSRTR